MKLDKKTAILIIVAIALIVLLLIFNINFDFSNKKSFEVNKIILKVLVKQNDLLTKTLQIKNIDSKNKNFDVNPDSGFILIQDRKFSLDSKETKFLNIDFDTKNPGVYLGKIVISNEDSKAEVPIILEVETKEVFFDSILSAPLDYSTVYLGEKAVIDVKIFNLERIGAKEVQVDYILSDFNGKMVFSESENLILEDQILNTKIIPLPKDINPGSYVFSAVSKYKDSIGTGSYFFEVKKKESIILSDSKYTLLIIVVSFFLIVFFLIYYMWYRDRLLIELQNLYKKELENQKGAMKSHEKKIISELKSPAEKKMYRKELKKIKRKRIDFIKKIHKKRIREFKKIKRGRKFKELRDKLKQWKSRGYDTSVLDKRFKFPNRAEIKNKLRQWKSRGYDTSVLEGK